MGTKITLQQGFVEPLLNHLSQYCELPATGILAGQALASSIMDLYGEGGGVYNDVDVFCATSAEKAAELAANRKAEAVVLGVSEAFLDDYGEIDLVKARPYTIEGSTRDGLLNQVWCASESPMTPGQLLDSFDLNCVEVAIDLGHKRLFWTPAFEYFLSNRQLEITALTTPLRTLIRYLKKRREMPEVYGDDGFVLDAVTAILGLPGYGGDFLPQFQPLTPKFASLASEFPQLQDRLEFIKNTETGVTVAHVRKPPEAGFTRRIADLFRQLGPTKLWVSAAYLSRRQQSAVEDKTLVHELEKSEATSLFFQTFGREYLRGNYSVRHAREVASVLEDHPQLTHVFAGLTLDQQYQGVRMLRRRAKKDGLWIYGLVETQGHRMDICSEEAFDDFLARCKQQELSPHGTQLFADIERKGWIIRELRTMADLIQEAEDLQHCVAGYASAISAGYSRILSIRKMGDPQRWSTVELSGTALEKKELVVRQHRSKRNVQPHPENERQLQMLIRLLVRKEGLTHKRSRKIAIEDDFAGWLLGD